MEKELTFLKKFFSVFSPKKSVEEQNREAAKKSLEYIFDSIDKLSQKAQGRMTEKWPELSERIKEICEQVHCLEPSILTVAGKIEQSIAQKITAASSACESLFSSGDIQLLKDNLADLERLVKQRMNPVSE